MSTTLNSGSLLQSGRYRIERVLGQGGFGITYLATHTGFDQKVALKEFYMKELCLRNEETSFVTLGTGESSATVERFRGKFLKEARNLFRLNNKHIVRVLDIFEENGTAYFAMEYAEGGSLSQKVKAEGALSEDVATRYILQVAEALAYLHEQKMNHLDVKPANIMLSAKDDVVLIDFGLAKQYDATGGQTSTTPAGISEGYAPLEQYKQGGVADFSPETDIYALGATFLKLLTGMKLPSASDVNEDGVPVDELRAHNVSETAIAVIERAMEPKRKLRMSSVEEFVEALGATPSEITKVAEISADVPPVDDEATHLKQELSTGYDVANTDAEDTPLDAYGNSEELDEDEDGSNHKLWFIAAVVAVILAVVALAYCSTSDEVIELTDIEEAENDFPENALGESIIYEPEIEQATDEQLPSAGDYVSISEVTIPAYEFSDSPEEAVQERVPKAKTKENVQEDAKVYNVVDEPPVFPGGDAALLKYVATHVKYPATAMEQDIQGVVNLRLAVKEDGSVGEVQVVKSLSKECDAEAIRVVKTLPRFIPGKLQGKPVKVWFSLPIRFQLQ